MSTLPTGETATTVGRLIAAAIGDEVMSLLQRVIDGCPKAWRQYRVCWCRTPEDCSPCQSFMRTKQSSPKAPKCAAPSHPINSGHQLVLGSFGGQGFGRSPYLRELDYVNTNSPKG